jgi:NAD(P)-dependent dehydrogenase (short-subunit alcohol dehydrogenase family)
MARKAVITGGARPDGIGWASAVALAEDDYDVVVTGATEAEVASADSHPRISATVLDVRDDEAVRALFARLERLDALVNCAGTADPATEYTAEGFSRTIDVNLVGTHRCCLNARALLAEAKGAIVNVGSMYSIFGSDVTPGYSASKGGVVQLTKSLAVAWGPDIRVNAVAPGWIKTGMARPVWENSEWAEAIVARTPLGRFGEPAELAEPIRFLCSDAARFVTGVLLPIDGGYTSNG